MKPYYVTNNTLPDKDFPSCIYCGKVLKPYQKCYCANYWEPYFLVDLFKKEI